LGIYSSLVHPFFVKKICIVGTESTGKSTLAKRLAEHYKTIYVPEMAREIIEETENCTYDDLLKIAQLHTQKISESILAANKLLIVDTDLNITRSYSQFLFNKGLNVDPWIEEVNQFDLYLFLEPDCEYIQDGTVFLWR
jgi:HTH-type transcriptional repressor of NAD biosynthesis genes